MLINVPQYIDVEDKVAGPLTIKQLGWLVAMGVTLFVLWSMLPKVVAITVGIPVALLFVALAFYKPYGQPLGNFIFYGVLYFFKPKFYVWKRTAEKIQIPQHTVQVKQETKTNSANKEKVLNNLEELARLLDSGGTEKDEQLMQILKKRETKK